MGSASGRVAIVGADGFIGRHLSRRLAAASAIDLVLIGRRFADGVLAHLCPRAHLVEADMASPEAAAACTGADAVVDLAASESPQSLAGRTPDEIAALASSHRTLYERLGGRGVRHVIALSSGGTVYGPNDASRISEDQPTRARSGYGLAKLMMEEGLDAAARGGGFDHTILRPSNCYGPGQAVKRRQGLMAAILDCHLTGRPLRVAGDGTNVRDYIFIDDVVSAIQMAIDRAPGKGERINVGSGRGTSILQLLDVFAAIAGRRIDVTFGPAHDFDLPRNVLDNAKARRLLGWNPEVSLEEGVRRLLGAAT